MSQPATAPSNEEAKIPTEAVINAQTKQQIKLQVKQQPPVSEAKNQGEMQISVAALTPEEWAEQQYDKLLPLMQEEKFSDAIFSLQKILAKVPDYQPARESLATLLIQQNKLDQAQQVLNQGLEQTPDYPGYIQLVARIRLVKGDVKGALNIV